jgi:hypothetical protein
VLTPLYPASPFRCGLEVEVFENERRDKSHLVISKTIPWLAWQSPSRSIGWRAYVFPTQARGPYAKL